MVCDRSPFSFISGISLLGTPTEIYIYGIQYLYIMGGIITMGFVMMYIYLPVFHDLKLTSTYQVRRASSGIRDAN
jgi:solute carrier family 5 (sodium-coupled monocarboxylate transporter), member 8/12